MKHDPPKFDLLRKSCKQFINHWQRDSLKYQYSSVVVDFVPNIVVH